MTPQETKRSGRPLTHHRMKPGAGRHTHPLHRRRDIAGHPSVSQSQRMTGYDNEHGSPRRGPETHVEGHVTPVSPLEEDRRQEEREQREREELLATRKSKDEQVRALAVPVAPLACVERRGRWTVTLRHVHCPLWCSWRRRRRRCTSRRPSPRRAPPTRVRSGTCFAWGLGVVRRRRSSRRGGGVRVHRRARDFRGRGGPAPGHHGPPRGEGRGARSARDGVMRRQAAHALCSSWAPPAPRAEAPARAGLRRPRA